MRPGVVVSIIGHVGAVLMTMLAWEARDELPSLGGGAVVPVEIVDVALESNVRALQQEDTGEEAATEDDPGPAEQVVEASAPTPTPTPRRDRNQEAFENLFNNPMVNYDNDRPRPRPTNGETSDETRPGAGQGTADAVALVDRVRSLNQRALMRCWRMPADLPEPDRLIVTVEFELDRNGNLRGQPRVRGGMATFDPPMLTAQQAALRAVRTCDFTFFPNDPVLGSRYDAWDDLDFTFRPPS